MNKSWFDLSICIHQYDLEIIHLGIIKVYIAIHFCSQVIKGLLYLSFDYWHALMITLSFILSVFHSNLYYRSNSCLFIIMRDRRN